MPAASTLAPFEARTPNPISLICVTLVHNIERLPGISNSYRLPFVVIQAIVSVVIDVLADTNNALAATAVALYT